MRCFEWTEALAAAFIAEAYCDDQAALWFQTPNRLLNGERPVDWLRTRRAARLRRIMTREP